MATPNGSQVVIPHHAVGHAKGGRVINRRGGPVDEPLDESMTYLAMCGCGVHAVHARDLAAAAGTGTTVPTGQRGWLNYSRVGADTVTQGAAFGSNAFVVHVH